MTSKYCFSEWGKCKETDLKRAELVDHGSRDALGGPAVLAGYASETGGTDQIDQNLKVTVVLPTTTHCC